jgi:hypothetical protein
MSSTLTTVAVFFPMVFVEGIAGQMFGDLGLTVVFSLLASLAVALFLIPMLASRSWIGGQMRRSAGRRRAAAGAGAQGDVGPLGIGERAGPRPQGAWAGSCCWWRRWPTCWCASRCT